MRGKLKTFLKAWLKDRGLKTFFQNFFVVLFGSMAITSADLIVLTPEQLIALPWVTAFISATATTAVSLIQGLFNPDFVIGDNKRD